MLDYYKFSDKGERAVNEDCIGVFCDEDFYAFALCDGLGAHGNGEVASKTVVDSFLSFVSSHNNELDKAFENANEALSEMRENNYSYKEMRTTAAFLIIDGNTASFGHIGDSRIYYFSNDKLIKRTLDHSVPQMLVEIGEIKEKDIRRHSARNKLLRCIPWSDSCYDIDETDLKISKGDSFIMMSDGFWDWIDEKAMKKVLKKSKTAKEAGERFTELAFKLGTEKNMDNLSLIVIRVV